jgi:hypothetical protein
LWVRNVEKTSNWCGFRSKADASYKKFGKHSDSEDETELFTLKKPSPRKEKASIEKVVEEGDTLQSLAIRYCCTVSAPRLFVVFM